MSQNLSRVYSAELEGIKARLIEVEVDLNVGLHAFNIVGLADKALNEAKERVNSALKNSGIKPPNRENRKITVNLAPADVRKTGSQYDLAITIGYLLATGQIKKFDASDKLFIGELALDGRIRPISGALNIAHMAGGLGFKYVFLPKENAGEASVVDNLSIIPVETIRDVIDYLENKKVIAPHIFENIPINSKVFDILDFSDVKGQESAKRALTIAAAGGHNILMIGPPGVGKSLLAQVLAGILPSLTLEEAIEVTKIYSAAGLTNTGGLIRNRPFRSPHQTASLVAIIGGGSDPKPGEISLAHQGILFLDELPEFQKNVLESLRQPLENGFVHIARAKNSLHFPAQFTLVAAMNPCPCGFYGDEENDCLCSAYEVSRYQKKVSGPLLDRIDLRVKVSRIAISQLRKKTNNQSESEGLKSEIQKVRIVQNERFKNKNLHITMNARMNSRTVDEMVNLTTDAEQFLEKLHTKKLSPRSYYKILKVSRTIADLEGSSCVSTNHIAEAFQYRLQEEI